jgi:hypothetical protein
MGDSRFVRGVSGLDGRLLNVHKRAVHQMSMAEHVDPFSILFAPEVGPHKDALVGLITFQLAYGSFSCGKVLLLRLSQVIFCEPDRHAARPISRNLVVLRIQFHLAL